MKNKQSIIARKAWQQEDGANMTPTKLADYFGVVHPDPQNMNKMKPGPLPEENTSGLHPSSQ